MNKIISSKINLSDTVLKVFLAVAIISLGTIWLANAVNPSTTIGTGISTATVTTTGNVSIGGILGVTGTTTFSSNVDFAGNQALNFLLESSATFPTSPSDGEIFWSTTTNTPYWYDTGNTRWRTIDHEATIVVAASDSQNVAKADYVADGTDDEVQIQAAIDALPSGGGKVVLLEGNYDSGPITLPSNITLSGMGPASILKMSDGADNRFIINNDRVGGNSNIVVENLYIDCNKDNQVEYGDRDVQGNGGCLDFREVTNLVVRNNIIDNAWMAGVETTESSYVQVLNNRIDDSADDGIGINENTAYAVVANNVISNSGLVVSYGGPNGIEVQDGAHDVAVVGNFVYNSAGDGIQISSHLGVAVVYNVTITGNSVFNSITNGIQVSGDDSTATDAYGITVTGNVISSSTNGIFFDYVVDSVIANNIMISNTTGLALTDNDRLSITGNSFKSNSGANINLDDSNEISIVGNAIQGGTYGADIRGTTVEVLVADNSVIGASSVGIYAVSVTDITVTGNNVTSGVADGIQLSSVSQGVVSNNMVVDNGSEGIYIISSTNVSVSGNVVENNTATGIYLKTSSSIVVSSNIVSGGGGSGIYFQSTSNSIISDNLSRENNTQGIVLDSGTSYISLVGNRSTDNGDAMGSSRIGISVTSDFSEIRGNTVVDTGEATQRYGIYVFAGGDSNIITDNRIIGSTSQNFNDSGASNVVRNNTGFLTENSGTSTIVDNTTSITVTHGLVDAVNAATKFTPSINNISVTPTSNMASSTKFWISSVGSTSFDINVDQDPNGDITFSWRIDS